MKRIVTAAMLATALLVAGCASYSKAKFLTDTASLAVTGEQRELAKAQEKLAKNPLAQLGGYLDAADKARRALARDPNNTLLQSDYNFAVARVMDIVYAQKLQPWSQTVVAPSSTGAPWRLRLTPPYKQRQFAPKLFEFRPSDRYDFRGKLVGERVLKEGIGAPLVVVGKDLDYVKLDRFAQGKNLYYGMTALVNFRGRDANITLYDPLARENVPLDGRTYPLAGDFQGPLALALDELHMEKSELLGLFKPQEFAGRARLARLQPYDARKIPVIFIHGLGNSPATWAPLIEFLRGDPGFRENYQVWFYSYPSGLPYPLAAAYLREQLTEIRRQHPGTREAVVVGHSMGGMISRLLITDSKMDLWDLYFDKPPDKLSFSEKTRRMLAGMLLFKPVQHISRIIFVSASHRGSNDAVGFWGRLGASVVGSPVEDEEVYAEAIAQARPEAREHSRNRLPNSIDLLDPDSLFLERVNSLPTAPGVPYHSLIGDRGKGGYLDRTKPSSSDGLVPYWSSHMDGARSERIIPSGHWSHLHPLGMAEIKRILMLHIGR
ncbi:MAG: lipase family alpha/beta hydrolase [Chthoniobacterales bacterium]